MFPVVGLGWLAVAVGCQAKDDGGFGTGLGNTTETGPSGDTDTAGNGADPGGGASTSDGTGDGDTTGTGTGAMTGRIPDTTGGSDDTGTSVGTTATGDPGTGGTTVGSGSAEEIIEVIITADNAYGFGYGSGTELKTYFGGVENVNTAGEIFNCPIGNGPERYEVPASERDGNTHLYIVAYADKAVSQGVIAQFRRFLDDMPGDTTFTGDDGWMVCATGVDFQPGSGGPSQAVIDEQIALCNAGAGDPNTTSAGWVDELGTESGALAIGEDNTTTRTSVSPGNEFPPVCEIEADARWMWFNWAPGTIEWPTDSPFMWPGGTENTDRQFLIFRLGSDYVPPVG